MKGFGLAGLILALIASGIVPRTLRAQPDTTEFSSSEFDASFRIYPLPIWSLATGFSAGVGYELENALIRRDRFLVRAVPGQHRGRYDATYFVGDIRNQTFYGLGSIFYEAAGRQWFYGVGPSSSVRDQIAVEKRHLNVQLRLGAQPLGRRLFVQPVWAYHRHDVGGFSNWESAAFGRLSPGSRRSLDAALGHLAGSSSVQHGISVGLDAGIDLRDHPVRTRRGLLVQASGRRYAFREPDGLEFDRYELAAYGYLPVDQNVLSLRILARFTEPEGDPAVPFYLLPRLDGRLLPGYAPSRFFGNDLLAVTAEYSVPVFQLLDFAALDAVVSVGVGSIYDDLAEQFEWSISFDGTLDADRNSYPLRPSAGVGLHVEPYIVGGWTMRALLGWSPEGIRIVQVGFVHDLQDLEPAAR